MTTTIDINCDLGEGMGSDAELLNIVTSANIACGAHAGDTATMRQTLALARQHGVAAGAHPGYRDREGFGRRPCPLADADLIDLIDEQIDHLATLAEELEYPLTHVRAHGALGNLTDADEDAAKLLVSALAKHPLRLMTLPNSAAERIASDRQVPVIRQFFADRAYDNNGQLVPRSVAGSVIHNETAIIRRLLEAMDRSIVISIEEREVAIAFESICVHGDTPNALALAEKIRKVLEDHGVNVRPFTE